MPLRAKRPEAIQKRLKLFMYGVAGAGKSTAAIQFPRSYIIDGERGTENYERLINESGSVVFQTNDMDEVVTEVKSLLTVPHDYRTLVIDPITTLYNGLLDKCEQQVGSEFGRHFGAANKVMKRLANLIMSLDMNVIVTAHAKKEYGPKLEVIGQTFDAWKQSDYLFDLVVELTKKGTKRMARVVKTRLEQFPDAETFEWSYAAVKEKYGADILERGAAVVALATPEQVRDLKEMLTVVRVPDGLVDKWLAKANVEQFEDMPADTIAKCIQYVRDRLNANTAAA